MQTQPKLGSNQIEVPAGTVLVHENDSSCKMFIIKEGKARVYKNYYGRKVTLAILGSGEVFGELSFFDAEPRSASVEALTSMSLVAIEGDKALKEIAGLPEWVMPILRTVFHRLREADRKMTVLQSMNEYQRRAFKTDTVAQTIYLELLRFIKTLKILYQREHQALGHVKSADLIRELEDILGNSYIGLRVFWRLLKDYDFLDPELESAQGRVVLRLEPLDALEAYLSTEVDSGRFLLLSHSAIALLQRILAFIQSGTPLQEFSEIPIDTLRPSTLPLYSEAKAELIQHKIVTETASSLLCNGQDIHQTFLHQTMIKSFDHTIVNLD